VLWIPTRAGSRVGFITRAAALRIALVGCPGSTGTVRGGTMQAASSPPGLDLRAELEALKPRALYRHAEEAGVDEAALDAAEDLY
jgi:hypothetical protein